MKIAVSQTTPMAIATSDAMAAPVTPNACPVPQPKMRIGASTMFTTTVPLWTMVPGLKLPMPRRAAASATIANWSAIAGMNHRR